MATTHRELALFVVAFGTKGHDMNRSARVLLKGEGLHDNEILGGSWQLDIYKFVDAVCCFEKIRVGVFA